MDGPECQTSQIKGKEKSNGQHLVTIYRLCHHHYDDDVDRMTDRCPDFPHKNNTKLLILDRDYGNKVAGG